MSDFLFSKTAQVEIQGNYALNFISLNEDAAEFEIIGLADPVIKLVDKRPDVRKKMLEILKTGQVEALAAYFNKPARVKMFPLKDGKLTIHLEKTRANKLPYMLWVAIGIKGEIPYYQKPIRLQIEQFEDDTFALFYLFKKPVETVVKK
jgi:hypothetical protein